MLPSFFPSVLPPRRTGLPPGGFFPALFGFLCMVDPTAAKQAQAPIIPCTHVEPIYPTLPWVTCGQMLTHDLGCAFLQDLMADLKSELSGDLARLILGLMLPPAHYDAKQLKKAMEVRYGHQPDGVQSVWAPRWASQSPAGWAGTLQ